jgi:hypothetical protein
MGYVHDTAMSRWLFPNEAMASAGTWTQRESTTAADLWCIGRSAADATFNLMIPIKGWQNSADGKGTKLVSIDIWFYIGTAALDSMAASIFKVTKAADNAALPAGVAVTFSYDTGHDTAGERIDADEHVMTLTLDTPVWLDHEDLYFVELACDAALTSVFEYLGSRVNYTLRV